MFKRENVLKKLTIIVECRYMSVKLNRDVQLILKKSPT